MLRNVLPPQRDVHDIRALSHLWILDIKPLGFDGLILCYLSSFNLHRQLSKQKGIDKMRRGHREASESEASGKWRCPQDQALLTI